MDETSRPTGAQVALLAALDRLLDGVPSGHANAASMMCLDGPVVPVVGEVDEVVNAWSGFVVDPSIVRSWTPRQARRGLVALEKVSRSVAAMRAALIVQVGLDRDSAAAVTRATGMSQRAAREAVRVAQTVSTNPQVGDLLAAGDVSAAQVSAVAGIDAGDAVGLLEVATSQSDDEFARTVERFKVDQGGRTRADRQRALRSVRFSDGPEGCVRMTAVLPPLEGAEVRGVLDRICDANWRKAHPERARVSGGHADEPRERRLADALIDLARGNPDSGTWANTSAPAVIVTVNAETLETTLLPDSALDPSVLVDVLPRAEVFAAIRDHTIGARLCFGRNRRLASPMQRLVLAMLQPRCTTTGCDVPAQRCEVHHRIEYDSGGTTDLPNLVNLCPAHHHHLHDHGQERAQQRAQERAPNTLEHVQ